MERAKVELEKHERCLQVSFEGTWDDLKNITTDAVVTLNDPRLPDGKISGKVVDYALIAKGETGERFVCVTLLCKTNHSSLKKIGDKSISHYVLQDYCEETYQIQDNTLRETASGLQYYRYDTQVPPQGEKGNILRQIELINGPVEQEAEMHRHKKSSTLKKALSQKPTRLRLYFKDLRTKECLEHTIECRAN